MRTVAHDAATSPTKPDKYRLIANRDQSTRCTYCETPLVIPDEVEVLCFWQPEKIHLDHCGCGKHVRGVEPCVEAGRWVAPEGHEWAQIDHVVPRSKGGPNTLDNLVLCCGQCNGSKGNRDVFEWLESR